MWTQMVGSDTWKCRANAWTHIDSPSSIRTISRRVSFASAFNTLTVSILLNSVFNRVSQCQLK